MTEFEILEGKAGGHRRAEQREATAVAEVGALPHAAGRYRLKPHARFEVLPQRKHLAASVGMEQEQVDRVAEVDVVDLVAGEAVEGGERIRR